MLKTKKRKAKQPWTDRYMLTTYDRHDRDTAILDAVGRDACDGSGMDLETGWYDMDFEFTSRAAAIRAARRVKKLRGVLVRLVGEIKV